MLKSNYLIIQKMLVRNHKQEKGKKEEIEKEKEK